MQANPAQLEEKLQQAHVIISCSRWEDWLLVKNARGEEVLHTRLS